jgi:drug/metabolite transporter (DMT)-like permease
MSGAQLRMLLTLAALWGASFLFIRVAVDEVGPAGVADGRLLFGSATLLVLFGVTRRLRLRGVSWPRYVALGLLNSGLPFTLIAIAELRLDASLAAILNAATPLFTAMVGMALNKERLTRRRGVGLVLGIAGVATVVGLAPVHVDLAFAGAVCCSLGAALCYAFGATVTGRVAAGEPTNELAMRSLLAAFVVLLPVAAVTHPGDVPPLGPVAAVAALGIACTGFAYLLYFRLIAEVGATSALTVTFLVPVFGVLWGAVFLGETITAGTLVGGALILSSVGLVANLRIRRAQPSAATTA